MLKQPSFWCFSFVTLFNLQGTCRSLAAGFNDITSGFACQELFLKFFQLFSALSSVRPVGYRAALTGDFERIPHSFGFVKNFFQVFSTFFPDRLIHLAFLPRFWLPGFSPAAERLLILADSPRFVNTFFRFFSSFFLTLFPGTKCAVKGPSFYYICLLSLLFPRAQRNSSAATGTPRPNIRFPHGIISRLHRRAAPPEKADRASTTPTRTQAT